MSGIPAYSQGHNGIPSDGKDFFIGYMPGIKHSGSAWSNVFETYYVIIGSYNDNNQITINYFDAATGFETSGPQHTSRKGECWQQRIDVSHMAPQRPGEIAQWCAAHIKSTYPVSVQCYSEGSSAGGMLQAIPTAALGKNYVIASWYDNPIQNNPGFINRDSSSGEFMIIAPFDYTTVTYTPASTTCAGIVGVSSGRGSDGTEHPHTIILRRGQVFWVRSLSVDASFDISGSVVTADKPIAVLAGHERALLGDPSGIWTTLDNDVRNIMLQQMTPVEDWDTDYVSIPMVFPPPVARLLVNGTGQMYRVYTADSIGGGVEGWIGSATSSLGNTLTPFQNPVIAYSNIVDPIDLRSRDGKKISVEMYEYFQGQHDFDPGSNAGKRAGDSTLSGGGTTVQDETTYKMPTEINLVPISRWKRNAVWKVPMQSTYRGYQWINVLASKDSFSTILLSYNSQPSRPLDSFVSTGKFSIPLHPELVGYQFQLPPGDYSMFSENTPFVVYSYGRTQTQYKDGWGYGSPCGQTYGTRDERNPPRMSDSGACAIWNIKIFDSRPTDEGIADIELLNDPQGVYERPARVSYNVSLNPKNPVFVVGDSVVNVQLVVNNPMQTAYAAVYAVDRAGNDTVFEFRYTPPQFTTNTATRQVSMVGSTVGTDSCTTVVLKNLNSTLPIMVDSVALANSDPEFQLQSTVPALPTILNEGDSLIANICYDAVDSGVSQNTSLIFTLDCGYDTIPISGSGITPIIVASDVDFGTVALGTTVCKTVTISNTGDGPLILSKNFILHDSIHFAISNSISFPLVVQPAESVQLNICYTPTALEYDSTSLDWSTNLGGQFVHHRKDYSSLTGNRVYEVVSGNERVALSEFTLELHPNPVGQILTMLVNAPVAATATIGIYDVLGREVRLAMKENIPAGSHSTELDVSGLSAGTYFLRLDAKGSILTKRFIVNR